MKNELSFIKKRRADILADCTITFTVLQNKAFEAALRSEYGYGQLQAVMEGFATALGFASKITWDAENKCWWHTRLSRATSR